MTVVSTKIGIDNPHRDSEPISRSDVDTKTSEPDPSALRAELGEKRKLLNLLESQGVHIEHGDEIKAQVEAALKDLDSIIDETA